MADFGPPERHRHGVVLIEGDARARTVHARVVDVIGMLHRRGAITDEENTAVSCIEAIAAHARPGRISCGYYERVDGGSRHGSQVDRALDATDELAVIADNVSRTAGQVSGTWPSAG